jgi:hypothetical protein
MRLNRIARQIRLTAVWLSPALAIDRVDQCTASTGVSSRVFDHPLHVLVGDPARRAGAGPVVQTVEPAGHEPTRPITNGRLVDTGSAEPLDRCFTLSDADVTEVRCAWSAPGLTVSKTIVVSVERRLGDPRAVEAEGHPRREVDGGHGCDLEVGCVDDDQVAGVAPGVVDDGEHACSTGRRAASAAASIIEPTVTSDQGRWSRVHRT